MEHDTDLHKESYHQKRNRSSYFGNPESKKHSKSELSKMTKDLYKGFKTYSDYKGKALKNKIKK